MLVEHAHEQLVMVMQGGLIPDRVDFLCRKHETPFLERSLQPGHPRHLAPAQKHLAVGPTIELNAIASLLFRHLSSRIGRSSRVAESTHYVRVLDRSHPRSA